MGLFDSNKMEKGKIEVEVIFNTGESKVMSLKRTGHKVHIDATHDIDFTQEDCFLMWRPHGILGFRRYKTAIRWREGTTQAMKRLGLKEGESDYLPALSEKDSAKFVSNMIFKLNAVTKLLSSTQFYIILAGLIGLSALVVISMITGGGGNQVIPVITNATGTTPTWTP